jgi:Protein of unknown function, DUF417
VNQLTNLLVKIGILKNDLDYHLIRASMVTIFLFFGYQKWFQYEAQALIPYISNGPLISWLYPVFGPRGATYFLGVAEWLFGGLLLSGFWNKNWVFSELSVHALSLRYRHDCPVYARWLGCVCRRVPRYDGKGGISNEGSRSVRCVVLIAEAGRHESVALWQTSAA